MIGMSFVSCCRTYKTRHIRTKDLLGGRQLYQDGGAKDIGVKWNYVQDQLVFDLTKLAILICHQEAYSR